MNWHIENARKKEKERDINENLFDKYKAKKVRGATSPESEQRELIAKLLNRPFRQVAGLTKGWTTQELYEIRRKSESFLKNPPALMWMLIKEHNKKIKEQLKNAENKTDLNG